MARVIQVRGRAQLDAVLAELDATVDPNTVIVVHNTVVGGKRVMPVYSAAPAKRDAVFKSLAGSSGFPGSPPNYLVTAGDLADYDVISCSLAGLSADATITFPDTPVDGANITISLADVGSGPYTLTLVAGSGDTIDGNPIVLTQAAEQVSLVFNNGTSKWIQV